ncbi:sugar O-acyltransferase (sialic acid O-acetyltransferase NeuD family) [Cryobacterium sp. MP_3.1]|uniref:Acetyltransferase n=1 Tax=Cryobacterium zongtaii TaxID=1259217 RepID=A0A2S3ZK06_9MICO|nr:MULTISPECIES: acetyltransferase [Cryobacterium]MEC5184933.1 sugar O-acyltransferase (sialic acid O-acetyltransferase NeuD family) [Cryobacterium sp. MP_3.1]POH68344.1 acetyltransferase [Cryobacterium zongtaii]
MRDVILLAASGLAREVVSAEQRDFRWVAILDDDEELHGSRVAGIDVIGGLELAARHRTGLLICVGSGAGRRRVADRLAALQVQPERYVTVIDASARVPASCTVGRGSVLLAHTVLTADVRVGRHVVVMPQATLTHDVVVGDFATLTAGVSLAGGVTVHEGAYLGMNATVRQNVVVGAGAIIGMGAAVIADVPAGETWAGVPARSVYQRSAV